MSDTGGHLSSVARTRQIPRKGENRGIFAPTQKQQTRPGDTRKKGAEHEVDIIMSDRAYVVKGVDSGLEEVQDGRTDWPRNSKDADVKVEQSMEMIFVG